MCGFSHHKDHTVSRFAQCFWLVSITSPEPVDTLSPDVSDIPGPQGRIVSRCARCVQSVPRPQGQLVSRCARRLRSECTASFATGAWVSPRFPAAGAILYPESPDQQSIKKQ